MGTKKKNAEKQWWNQPIAPVIERIYPNTLEVEILVAGDGSNYPRKGDLVQVHYVAYLPNGKVFDATFRRGQPFKFRLGHEQVISGLDTAISQLSVGERAKIKIGYELAYGKRGFPNLVPPCTGLIFDLFYQGSCTS